MANNDVIARAIDGDDAAQRTLYEAYCAAAFRLTYLLLQNAHDAEEVVQDAFAYLFRNLRRYDEEKGSFWAWLRVTLVSRCHNKRRRRRLPLISLESLETTGRSPADPSLAGDPVHTLEMQGTRRAVWEALQQISPGAQEAIVLRYYEELAYAEIAEVLGCSPEAARARVAHGKLQLRRLLDGQEDRLLQRRGARSTVRVG
jgi:RNA polymerase sigma-70 factor (ECF subfamily)